MAIYLQRKDTLAPLVGKLERVLEEYLDTLGGEAKDHKVCIVDIDYQTNFSEDGTVYTISLSARDVGIKKAR